jgi:hypothetical protein
MPQDNRRSELWWDGPQGPEEVGLRGDLGRVRAVLRAAEPAQQLAYGSNPRPPAIGDRQVDGDPVNPGFSRSVRTPPGPGLEGMHESVLSAVLGLCGIGQYRDERPEYTRVRHAVQAIEIVP